MDSLHAGDTVAIVSPSVMLSPRRRLDLHNGIAYLESLGFKIKTYPTTFNGLRLNSSSTQDKARDIMQAYLDPEVKALFAAHGGAASLRVLPLLDFAQIKAHPKPLIGFSDSSSIQMGIYSQTGLPYVSGFLCEYDFRSGSIDNLVAADLNRVINGQKFAVEEGVCLREGLAEGILLGGNLSILSDLTGTHYYPDLTDKILLVEDESEKPYKISLMLTQLRLNPAFSKVKAVVFGRFSDCDYADSTFGTVDDVIADFAAQITVPVLKDFNYGHFPSRHVLPLGVPYKLDTGQCRLEQI